MKFKYSGIFMVLLTIILGSNLLLAQVSVNKVAQTSMKFLSVSVGARSAAMGDAFVAVADNAEAVYSNPAGITELDKKFNFAAGYNKWITGITHNYGSFLYNGGSLGVFGVNMVWIDYGDIDGTRRSSVDPRGYIETGSLSPNAFALGMAYGKAVSDRFSFGVNLKYVQQDLGQGFVSTDESTESIEEKNYSLGLFAFDFGTLYYTGYKDLRFAMSISNISQEKEFIRESAPLPLLFKFGIAMDLMQIFTSDNVNQLVLSIDALHPRDFTERLHFGFEYVYNNLFALRAGYKINYDEEGLSFGFGVRPGFDGLNIDYAFSSFGRFDPVHRVSIQFSI